METSLIAGKHVSTFDDVLGIAIGFANAPPLSGQHLFCFGIENEFGEIYRIVGVNDSLIFTQILKRLGNLQYVVETLPAQSPNDLRAIVKVPRLDNGPAF